MDYDVIPTCMFCCTGTVQGLSFGRNCDLRKRHKELTGQEPTCCLCGAGPDGHILYFEEGSWFCSNHGEGEEYAARS